MVGYLDFAIKNCAMMRCLFLLFLLVNWIRTDAQENSYILNESAYFSTFKTTTASFILRKLYGQHFNKYTNIKMQSEDLGKEYFQAMDQAAEMCVVENVTDTAIGKIPILNVALNYRVSKELDDKAKEFYKDDSFALNKKIRYLTIIQEDSLRDIDGFPFNRTLYYENKWCQALKNLIIIYIFSEILGEEFKNNCLPNDNSEYLNKQVIHYDKIIEDAKLEATAYCQTFYGRISKKPEMHEGVFDYRLSEQLDKFAGTMYRYFLWSKRSGNKD